MFSRLLLALLILAPLSTRADDSINDSAAIQRYMVNLYLGDTMDEIQKIYPPASEWPSFVEPRTHVKRYRVERAFTKFPAAHADTMWLGLKRGRLVEIQLVYTAAYTRTKPADALAADMALIYGQPHSNGSKYWWTDGRTVLRIFFAEVPILKDGGTGVELRTSLQLLEAGLFPRGE